MEIPCDDVDQNLFTAAIAVTLSDGKKAKFWSSAWLNGAAPKDLASEIYKLSRRKKQTVSATLQNGQWVHDINNLGGLTSQHIQQFVGLWTTISQIHLDTNCLDEITWRLTPEGIYSTKSTYALHFLGSTSTNYQKAI